MSVNLETFKQTFKIILLNQEKLKFSILVMGLGPLQNSSTLRRPIRLHSLEFKCLRDPILFNPNLYLKELGIKLTI